MSQDTNTDHDPAGRAPASIRPPRSLSGPILAFDLAREAGRLRGESPWLDHGTNAVTLVKHLRIVYMLMKPGAHMPEHRAAARISVHTLSGHVRLHLAHSTVDLPAGHLLALERDIPHGLEAVEESAVLLTIAWQGE